MDASGDRERFLGRQPMAPMEELRRLTIARAIKNRFGRKIASRKGAQA